MQILVNIDEALFVQARALTEIKRVDDLLEAGLTALIQRESGIRLAKLGGSQPSLQDIPRRRSELPEG